MAQGYPDDPPGTLTDTARSDEAGATTRRSGLGAERFRIVTPTSASVLKVHQ
jgi:hypothetical protein